MNLDSITALIEEELQQFRKTYKTLIHSEISILNDVTDYLNQTPGKQLRPMLMLLCNGASCKPNSRIDLLATAMELLHNASLIHDDVVDESELRRGQPTVNSRWGNKKAVLCGDYYLAQVMLLLNQYDDNDVTQVVNQTAVDLSEGELLQQMHSSHQDLGEHHYMETIYKKTAALMATCCELGALNTPYRSYMREIGRYFGMAFQMRDDMLDFHPAADTGKPTCNDILERKMTLPIICLLRNLSETERKEILSLYRQPAIGSQDIERISQRVLTSGAMNDAYTLMAQQADMAIAQCALLPATPYRDALIELCNHLKSNL